MIEMNGNNNSIEKLSIDVNRYLFTFFSYSQLKTNRLVCKEFKNISDHAINSLMQSTSRQIFYVVGEPILINFQKPHYNFTFHLKYNPCEELNFRKDITSKEIISSFQPKEKIKLFKLEEDARAYACFLRKSKSFIYNGQEYENIYQPAIFKVQYLESLKNIKMTQKDFRVIFDASRLGLDSDLDRKVTLEFFEIEFNKDRLLPIIGMLKIESYKKGNFIEYPPAEFKINLNTNNKNYLPSCTII